MRPDEFFEVETHPGTDIFGAPSDLESDREVISHFRIDWVAQLRQGPVLPRSDTETAVALAFLIDSELKAYGTDGNQRLDNDEMREALRALRAVLTRLNLAFPNLPFRDFESFRSCWSRHGAAGSGGWQARRDLVDQIFGPIHDALADLEGRELASNLVDPVSPHQRTGWFKVDVEIGELRRHFVSARTPQDYRAIGLGCVEVLNAVSAVAYDPTVHLRNDETEPPIDQTKSRLDRVVQTALIGRENAKLRKYAKALIEFAQEVKHSETPTRRDAGIAAYGVIQLANVMRRLSQEI